MSAPMYTRPHPASTGRTVTRLPWWALALPTLAFVTLLALILNPADAHAAGGEPAITHILDAIRQVIAR